jgi:hypothetical protein
MKAQYTGSKGFLKQLRDARIHQKGCVRPQSHVWVVDLGCKPRQAAHLYLHEWMHYLDSEGSYDVAWIVVSASTQRKATLLAHGGFQGGEFPLRQAARTFVEADIWLREAVVGQDVLLDMERHSLELAAQRQDELAQFIRTAEGRRIVEMLHRLRRIQQDTTRTPETIQEACEGLLSLAVGRFLGVEDPAEFTLPSFRSVHEESEGGEYFVEIDEDFDL